MIDCKLIEEICNGIWISLYVLLLMAFYASSTSFPHFTFSKEQDEGG